MIPEQIVERRKALGWSRKRFAAELGVTTNVAWRIEHTGPNSEEERALVDRVLGVTDSNGEHPEDIEWTGETIDTSSWRGLNKGDACTMLNPDGTERRRGNKYKFIRYFRSETQEYVEVYGYRGTRCVSPDRIRDVNGRQLCG